MLAMILVMKIVKKSKDVRRMAILVLSAVEAVGEEAQLDAHFDLEAVVSLVTAMHVANEGKAPRMTDNRRKHALVVLVAVEEDGGDFRVVER